MSKDTQFWSRTWQERCDAIEAAIGPMLDDVVSFSWPTGPRIPGACAVTMPPRDESSEWVYLSMGLSQPLSASEVQETRSGFGFEVGVVTDKAAPWAAELLYELVTYFTEPDARSLGWGDRVAFGSYVVDGSQHVLVGAIEDAEPIGELRALLVWPFLRKRTFLTSTGTTDIVIATGITEGEWALAKATTSQHLLLLLTRAGIGQKTDLNRGCLTRDAAAMAWWVEIQRLSAHEAWDHAMGLHSAGD